MLRITVDENDDRWQMRLEGKLSGEWVRETGAVWASAPNKRREIDLRGVTGTDDAGKGLLESHASRGSRLARLRRGHE